MSKALFFSALRIENPMKFLIDIDDREAVVNLYALLANPSFSANVKANFSSFVSSLVSESLRRFFGVVSFEIARRA